MKLRRGLAITIAMIVIAFAFLIAPAFACADIGNPDTPDQAALGSGSPSTTVLVGDAGNNPNNDLNQSPNTNLQPADVQAGSGDNDAGGNNVLGVAGTGNMQPAGTAGVGNGGSEGTPLASGQATANPTDNNGTDSKLSVAGGNNAQAAQEAPLSAQNENAAGAVGDEEELNVALMLAEGALSGSASGPVSWASGKILTAIFGSNMTGDVDDKLDLILQNLEQIRVAIAELQKTVNAQELDNILNSMKPLIESNKPHLVLSSLQSLNKEQYSEDEFKDRLKSVLTEDMGNGLLSDYGTLADPNNTFDTFCTDLWRAMTTTFSVTLDGKSQELTLMQVYYEHLRLKYKWEHQAYQEWEDFNNRCVSLLASTLALERASLKTRLELLREYNANHADKHDEGAVITLLNDTQDQINRMKGFVGEVSDESRDPQSPTVKRVFYTGLFNKSAWNSQYWMYKARPDYRYYWVPGHECLFYAKVNTQDVPYEDTSGSLQNPQPLQGVIIMRSGGGYDADIVYDHWKPFLNYQGGDSPLVSKSQLKAMYEDYGSDTHLYTIFIDKDYGNFLGLDEGNMSHWWFIVGQTEDHHVKIKDKGGYFELYTYVLSSAHAEQDTIDLARYGEYISWWNSNRHYIGIGVVRYGPETYNPPFGIADTNTLAKAEAYTTAFFSNGLARWWPSYGDLELGYDSDIHGSVKSVLVDGSEIDTSCYTASDGKVVFTQAFMASLSFGDHEFFLNTEKGGHSISLSTQADGVYFVASGEGVAWAPGLGDGVVIIIKRTADDAQTIYRLVDVLVDGVSVPEWGYTTRAGSAIIMLTDAFLRTLAPGAHTLTAVFMDGNNPQVSFTVNAASASAVAAELPRTGDSPAFELALLAIITLLSLSIAACAALCVRRDAREM